MKMSKKFDGLNDAFNVDGEVVSIEKQSVEEKIETLASTADDIKKDYEYARGN